MKSLCLSEGVTKSHQSSLNKTKQKIPAKKRVNLDTSEALLAFKASKQMRLFLLKSSTWIKKEEPKLHPFFWLWFALSAGSINVC